MGDLDLQSLRHGFGDQSVLLTVPSIHGHLNILQIKAPATSRHRDLAVMNVPSKTLSVGLVHILEHRSSKLRILQQLLIRLAHLGRHGVDHTIGILGKFTLIRFNHHFH